MIRRLKSVLWWVKSARFIFWEYFQNADCVDWPYCTEDGFYFTGPVCSIAGSCSCIDRDNGAVSVSSEGVELTTQVFLPADFFGSWMAENDFSCDLFSSDASATASLAEYVPEDVLSQIDFWIKYYYLQCSPQKYRKTMLFYFLFEEKYFTQSMTSQLSQLPPIVKHHGPPKSSSGFRQ